MTTVYHDGRKGVLIKGRKSQSLFSEQSLFTIFKTSQHTTIYDHMSILRCGRVNGDEKTAGACALSGAVVTALDNVQSWSSILLAQVIGLVGWPKLVNSSFFFFSQ